MEVINEQTKNGWDVKAKGFHKSNKTFSFKGSMP